MPRHADRPGSPSVEAFDVGGDSDMPGGDQPVTRDGLRRLHAGKG